MLDLSVITSIRALSAPGEPDIFVEVMQLFLGDVPVQVSALRAAIGTDDIDAVWRIAHHLRGSAVGIGAIRMASACATIEHAARAGSLECVVAQADRLDREFAAVRRELTLVSRCSR